MYDTSWTVSWLLARNNPPAMTTAAPMTMPTLVFLLGYIFHMNPNITMAMTAPMYSAM
jgi:hypothetical protein